MKQCSDCKEFKELTEFYWYKGKYVKPYNFCKKCNTIRCIKYQKTEKGKLAKQKSDKNYYLNHKLEFQKRNQSDEHKNSVKKYRLSGKEKETRKKWKKNNTEKVRRINSKWRTKNKAHMNALFAKRRCNKLLRTPSWLTKDDFRFIGLFYKESKRLTEVTGVKHHVDHIIPLQGENISGLHVPWNLQILTEQENKKKHNNFIQGKE